MQLTGKVGITNRRNWCRHPAINALQHIVRHAGRQDENPAVGLLGIAILFGLIELAALFAGIRLSRSMTLAVAELYSATQHVNRGDLTYRI
jgi:hypothetical protein